MPTTVQLTVTTTVTEANPECILGGSQEEGTIFMGVDARRRPHHELLGLEPQVELHWSKETRCYEAQELSVFPWPIRYRVTTSDAWYSAPYYSG